MTFHMILLIFLFFFFQIYKRGYDSNFFLVIVDFNSTDVDIFKLRENSDIKDRFVSIISTYSLQQFTVFK